MSSGLDVQKRAPVILVIDDDRDGRELMEIVLGYEGFLVVTAASGEEGLADMVQECPDLILLDVRMPDMDGYEVAARIKGNVATMDIPFIMMSGLSERDAQTLCANAGAVGFLAKPMVRAEIVLRVREALGLAPSGPLPRS